MTIGFLLAFLLIAGETCNAFACTALYVGPDASDDGTIIIARSNDYPDVWPNYITVVDRVEDKPGRTMPIDNNDTVFVEIPATTYKYTATPWMESATEYNGLESDAAACTNEYGVVMTMSISSFTKEEALLADPEPANGLSEFTADDLVICQSKTAREAVEVLLGLIDKYGSSESNIALISDQKEAWYVEMYTGHEYAAVKLPVDAVCVFGNEYNLEYLSDYEDSIVSKNLERLAVDNHFAVYGENGELNLLKTYAIEPIVYSHMRTWIGHKILDSDAYGDFDINEVYPLCFEADEKVSVKDAMEIMRNRFEGTKYSPDETGRLDMRVIGTDTALSVHVLQIYPDLPAKMSCVTWESVAPALYGIFIPVSNMSNSVSESYGKNQSYVDFGDFDTDNYPWYSFKALNTACISDYKAYGTPVREYWSEAETNMIAGMKNVLKTAAESNASESEVSKYITDYCNAMQEQAFADSKQMLNDVLWYQSKNSNTMKVGRNPETHEATDKVKEIEPIKITLDGSVYKTVPELKEYSTNGCSRAVIIVIAVLAVAVCGGMVLLGKKKKVTYKQ